MAACAWRSGHTARLPRLTTAFRTCLHHTTQYTPHHTTPHHTIHTTPHQTTQRTTPRTTHIRIIDAHRTTYHITHHAQHTTPHTTHIRIIDAHLHESGHQAAGVRRLPPVQHPPTRYGARPLPFGESSHTRHTFHTRTLSRTVCQFFGQETRGDTHAHAKLRVRACVLACVRARSCAFVAGLRAPLSRSLRMLSNRPPLPFNLPPDSGGAQNVVRPAD